MVISPSNLYIFILVPFFFFFFNHLTLLHSKWPKCHCLLTILRAIGFNFVVSKNMLQRIVAWKDMCGITLLHSERPKLNGVLAVLSAVGWIIVLIQIKWNFCCTMAVSWSFLCLANRITECSMYFNGVNSIFMVRTAL